MNLLKRIRFWWFKLQLSNKWISLRHRADMSAHSGMKVTKDEQDSLEYQAEFHWNMRHCRKHAYIFEWHVSKGEHCPKCARLKNAV